MLVEAGWPLRQHLIYVDSIALIMDVFEQMNEEQAGLPPGGRSTTRRRCAITNWS